MAAVSWVLVLEVAAYAKDASEVCQAAGLLQVAVGLDRPVDLAVWPHEHAKHVGP